MTGRAARYAFVILAVFVTATSGSSTGAFAAVSIEGASLGAGGGPAVSASYQLWGVIGQVVAGSAAGATVGIDAGVIACRRGTAGALGVPAPSRPAVTQLSRVAPNPTASGVAIAFDLATAAPVSIRIFDVSGRLVRVVVDSRLEPGAHSIAWDGAASEGRRAGSGLYFLRFEADGVEQTKRITVIR